MGCNATTTDTITDATTTYAITDAAMMLPTPLSVVEENTV